MKAGPVRRHGKDRGAALLMVLWGATVMSLIAAASAREASQIATSVNAGAELTRARALADAGVRLGWNAWADGDLDPAANRLNCLTADGGLFLTVRPENTKADLNTSSEVMLRALVVAAGADDARSRRIAAEILDYRDADSDRTDNGAEADDYAAAGLSWRPRDGAFEAVEELGYLPGMDSRLYRRIRNDVTVYSRTSEIDIEGASDLLLSALSYYSSSMSDGDLESVPEAAPRAQGRRVSTSGRAPGSSSAQRPGAVGIRAVAVTVNGAVFVREAVVTAPALYDDAPRLLRLSQGRLEAGEGVPDLANAPPCVRTPD